MALVMPAFLNPLQMSGTNILQPLVKAEVTKQMENGTHVECKCDMPIICLRSVFCLHPLFTADLALLTENN